MDQRSNGRPESVEWPTVAVAIACWSTWAALLAWHDRFPTVVVVGGFALVGAWYMSLQHEVVHGHPTPSTVTNRVLAGCPLALWLPFWQYSESHLVHHAVELTRPGTDPESFFVTQAQWDRAGRLRRMLLEANFTLLGRFVAGPAVGISATLTRECRRVVRQPSRLVKWIRHLAAASVVMWVVVAVAGVPLWQYLLGFCYLGLSLTYLRSFAEHRPTPDHSTRSAVVRSGRFFGTLFLFNNLHHTHHVFPGAAWYRLPELNDEIDAPGIAARGAGYYRGYVEVARRYGLRPIASPIASPITSPGDTVAGS